MVRLDTYPHKVARCTVNKNRPWTVAARVRCECGALFYGATRWDALDAWTPHVLAANEARVFQVVGAQA